MGEERPQQEDRRDAVERRGEAVEIFEAAGRDVDVEVPRAPAGPDQGTDVDRTDRSEPRDHVPSDVPRGPGHQEHPTPPACGRAAEGASTTANGPLGCDKL